MLVISFISSILTEMTSLVKGIGDITYIINRCSTSRPVEIVEAVPAFVIGLDGDASDNQLSSHVSDPFS